MNNQMQWYVQHGTTRVQAECRSAISRIAQEKHIPAIVRMAQVHVRPEFRAVLRRDVQAVHEAAHRRIESLLADLPERELFKTYQCLCGHFPDLAHKVKRRQEEQQRLARLPVKDSP